MKKLLTISITIIIVFLIIIFLIPNNSNNITVFNYEYFSKKIDKNLNGYKILQISDFHNTDYKESNLLEIISSQLPNLIVITGDIVDSYNTNIENSIRFINSINSIVPIYYITGNHEHRLSNNNYNTLINELKKAKVTILDNSFVEIKYNNSSFYLFGLNDKSLSNSALDQLSKTISNNKLKVLLAHEPQYFENYTKCNMDLILSGHAHGGQFRLPYIGGIFAPGQGFFPKYTLKDYHMNNSTLIVNRGLGNSLFPFRINNNPEIVTIKFIEKPT